MKTRFDDPRLNGTPYNLADVAEIEADRKKAYPRLRKTVELLNNLRERVVEKDSERYDRFFCAAITGLLARGGVQPNPEDIENLIDTASAVADEAQMRRVNWRDEVSESALEPSREDVEEIPDPQE